MKKGQTVLIGAFIIFALVVAVGSVIAVSGSLFFNDRREFVSFFAGSTQGLRKGARVAFRGVQIGEVVSIKLIPNSELSDWSIAVTFNIDPQALGIPVDHADPASLDRFLAKGLRVRLEMESFVTGLLYLNMDFFPDTEEKLLGLDLTHREIPTIPSRLQQVGEQLEQIPLTQTIDEIRGLIVGARDLFKSERLSDLIANATGSLTKVGELADEGKALALSLRERLQVLSSKGEGTLGAVDGTLREVNLAVKSLQEVLREVQLTLDDRSPTRNRLEELIREWTMTAESIRRLSDDLARRPESVVRGKR